MVCKTRTTKKTLKLSLLQIRTELKSLHYYDIFTIMFTLFYLTWIHFICLKSVKDLKHTLCVDTRGRCCYLGEAAAVMGHDHGVWTLQLLDDLKALVELREDVHHGAGEERVLRGLLELSRRRRKIIIIV